MPEPSTVRGVTPADVAALLPLVEAYWAFESIAGFEPVRVASQLDRLLATPSLGAGWIAMADDVPVGYLLGVYVFSLEHLGLTAEIDELFVLPDRRSSGIGSEMLRLAEAEFIRAGCTNVSLQLSRTNAASRRFYGKLGYAERAGFELLDKTLVKLL